MGSPSSSPFSFLDPAEQPLERPQEWTPALVLVPLDPSELLHARLLLQGTSLQLSVRPLNGALRVVGRWPRCGTGNYRLVLEVDDDGDPGTSAHAEQLIAIRPQKITQSAFLALINDLQGDALPTSIALALERTGGLAGVHLEAREATTLEQELLRLRRAVDGPGSQLGPGGCADEDCARPVPRAA